MELPSSSQNSSISLISNGDQWFITSKKETINELGADNLVGWWKFENESGNTLSDSSGQDNTATANLMASANISVSSRISSGMSFDGVDDYVAVSNDQSLHGMSQLTVSAWIYLRGKTNWDRVLDKSDNHINNSNRSYRLLMNDDADQKLYFIVWNASSASVASFGATGAPLNQWIFVTGTYDGAKVKFYENAVLQDTSNLTGAVYSDAGVSNTLSIGHGQYNVNNGFALNGDIDDVRIYNRALTPEEIRALYEQGL